MRSRWGTGLGAMTALALPLAFGCATQSPELVAARAAHDEAVAGPAASLRPGELNEATRALEEAEKAAAYAGGRTTVDNMSYSALRKSELADALAEGDIARRDAAVARLLYAERLAVVERSKRLAAEERLAAADQQMRDQAESSERKRMAALAMKEDARGTVITVSGSVLFRSDDATLLPSAEARLDQVAEVLKRSPDRSVVVDGHADSRGSRTHNRNLSRDRAEAVRAYLVEQGVPAEQVVARGIGEEAPIATNGTAEGRANNRRVEVVIARPGEKAPEPGAYGRRPPPRR